MPVREVGKRKFCEPRFVSHYTFLSTDRPHPLLRSALFAIFHSSWSQQRKTIRDDPIKASWHDSNGIRFKPGPT